MPSSFIFVRMKFVVPLIIPMISVILLPARHCFSGRIMGIPPATAASNSKSQWYSPASSSSSCPCIAIRSLLAVTTCLPFSNAALMYVRAGSIPPITSTTMSMLSSPITSSQTSVSFSAGILSAYFALFRTRTFTTSSAAPILKGISSFCLSIISYTPPPTVPMPSKAIFLTACSIFCILRTQFTFKTFVTIFS